VKENERKKIRRIFRITIAKVFIVTTGTNTDDFPKIHVWFVSAISPVSYTAIHPENSPLPQSKKEYISSPLGSVVNAAYVCSSLILPDAEPFWNIWFFKQRGFI